MAGSTVTTDSATSAGQGGGPTIVQLFVALQGSRPLDLPSRHLLTELDAVAIGRGKGNRAARHARAGLRRLELRLEDERVSTEHAQLLRIGGGRWVIEDAGAKNGIHINGKRTRRAVLLDGDVIEVGRTLLLYRDAVPAVRPDVVDLTPRDLSAPVEELRSFTAAMAEIAEAIARVAPARSPVVLRGATGTGKEIVARALHALSGRAGAFVPVNCGALTTTLLEASIFGHRKGAFSGAVDDRPGLARAADGGTLFLDEVGDLPLSSQTAFLRVLQEQEVVPVGDSRPVKIDLRIISATHQPIEDMVARGQFRADLHARLTGVTLRLPPLAERREDLGLLVGQMLRRAGASPDVTFDGEALRALFAYAWPANVRELERALGGAAALAGGGRVRLEHLPETLRGAGAPTPQQELQADEQRIREELVSLLIEHQGNVAAVARALGKGRMQVHRWVRRFQLELNQFRRQVDQ